jgi:hypothetical protein
MYTASFEFSDMLIYFLLLFSNSLYFLLDYNIEIVPFLVSVCYSVTNFWLLESWMKKNTRFQHESSFLTRENVSVSLGGKRDSHATQVVRF